MSRRLPRTAFASLLPALTLTALGCQQDAPPPDDQASLQALLQDQDLVFETRGALSLTPPDAGSSDGASAGKSGAAGAGTTGMAGSVGMGSGGAIDAGTSPTGSAGSAFDAGGDPAFDAGSPDGGAAGSFMTGAAGVNGKDGGFTGMAGGGGFPSTPLGRWTFDDCNPNRTDLQESFNGHTAFRSVGVQCAPGISGQAVSLSKTEDIVYVPDQPDFTFANGITVAGWFNPTSTKQVRSLMRKRDEGTSDFALLLNDGNYQFVVNLGGGRAASVQAPKKALAKTWTHVAGTYDGSWLRLYIGGVEVSKLKVKGTITPGPGPLLMGNDGSERRLDGLIDTTFFDSRAATADEVMALTCVHSPPTLSGTPATSAPTPSGTTATFDISVVNNNTAACPPEPMFFETQAFFPGIAISPQFQDLSVPSGTTTHVPLQVTASDDPEPGTFTIPFLVFDESPDSAQPVFGSVDFVLAPSACPVRSSKELMITSPSVVDDPVRTADSGVWTFKHLMEAMAPTAADAPAMVEQMLTTFTGDETFNSFPIEARPGMQGVLSSWPRTPDGGLDLANPPLLLQAIVNRFDLRNLDNGDAGEGRFVFAFMRPPEQGGFPFQATLILEYKLPATTEADVQNWADSWHALEALTQGTPEYNAALEGLTERFAARGVRPDHTNGSSINAVRTNEIDFGVDGRWQLREFVLSGTTGRLVPASIKLTPDLSFNGTDTLAAFVNANAPSIIAETHTVPDTFQGAPFVAGSVFNDLIAWIAPGIADNEARFHFSLNTCNGCHSTAETGTAFLQINPRFGPGGEAFLSGFLTGTTVSDPVTGNPRSFNDLERRATDLKSIVCPASASPPPSGMTGTGGLGGAGGIGGLSRPIPVPVPLKTSLRRGISRVH